jgi:hypothetical protein
MTTSGKDRVQRGAGFAVVVGGPGDSGYDDPMTSDLRRPQRCWRRKLKTRYPASVPSTTRPVRRSEDLAGLDRRQQAGPR